MQLFILGKTKSGKSTLARTLTNLGFNIYEAGAWARDAYKEHYPDLTPDEFDPVFKVQLTQLAQSYLKQNPYHSLEQYQAYLAKTGSTRTAIVGVRNPDDFIHMLKLDRQNQVIFLQSAPEHTGTLVQFESGLDVIEQYLNWRKANQNPIPVFYTCSTKPDLTTFLKEPA